MSRHPLSKRWWGIIEELAVKVQQQEEEIQQLKDEVAILKGEKKRPKFKPSKLDQEAGKDNDDEQTKGGNKGKRPGSNKRSKTAKLKIHEQKVIPPSGGVPPGSRFKGYRDFIIQDLVILKLLRADHTDYRLNDQALAFMKQQQLPKAPLQHLHKHREQSYANEAQWEAHLQCLGITCARHRRIATEGALLGSILAHGLSPKLAIISDDAGQFNA